MPYTPNKSLLFWETNNLIHASQLPGWPSGTGHWMERVWVLLFATHLLWGPQEMCPFPLPCSCPPWGTARFEKGCGGSVAAPAPRQLESSEAAIKA